MSAYVLWLMLTHGVTQVVTLSKVCRSLRAFLARRFPKSLGSLVVCPMCFGFWVGLAPCSGLWLAKGVRACVLAC